MGWNTQSLPQGTSLANGTTRCPSRRLCTFGDKTCAPFVIADIPPVGVVSCADGRWTEGDRKVFGARATAG